MPQHGSKRRYKTRPTRRRRCDRCFLGASNPAGQKAQLIPPPYQQCTGECAIACRDTGLIRRMVERKQSAKTQHRGDHQTHGYRRARHTVQQDHDTRAEPPDKNRKPERHIDITHAWRPALSITASPRGHHANLLRQRMVFDG